jgi:lipoprotein
MKTHIFLSTVLLLQIFIYGCNNKDFFETVKQKEESSIRIHAIDSLNIKRAQFARMIAEDNAPQRTRNEALEIAHKYFNKIQGEKLRKK